MRRTSCEALLDHLCQLGELAALRAALPSGVLGAQRDRRQRLADLVVQLARDPQSLCFLRGQRSRRSSRAARSRAGRASR